jgi:spore germination cell wall hydrolase CwlJ-like protein
MGAAVGVVLGGAYLAGGMAQRADAHARAATLADAAARGFSETALQDEAMRMQPGALALAQRYDPFAAVGATERDREAVMFVSQTISRPGAADSSGALPLLRASFAAPANPEARPFHLAGALESTRDLDCLADAVYYEARGETPAGQAAIAQVVLNRVRHPAFPKSVCGVVFQGASTGDSCQFSFACDGSMTRPREPIAWRRARDVASHALAGFVMPSIGNATHFHVVGLDPNWGPRLLRVAQIGLHVFYRFGGYAGAPGSFTGQPERSAPGSEAIARPVYASMLPIGDATADGRPAAQYVLANATLVADATPKAAPVSTPLPAAPAPVGAANVVTHDAMTSVSTARPAASTPRADPAPKVKADPIAKPETTAAAVKPITLAAS